MKYRIQQIKTDIDVPVDDLPCIAARKLRIRVNDIESWEIRRKSIDSRKKPHIQFVYTVDFVTGRKLNTDKNPNLSIVDEEAEAASLKAPACGSSELHGRPVVVGSGPAGLFAALELAENGYMPIVIERGPEMSDRVHAVEKFKNERVLNPEANLLFGEGGAGTFSDGKLATGVKDSLIRKVLADFRDAGAGDEIMYLARPHIGTDVLRTVIVNLRNRIEELGGGVCFNTRFESLEISGGAVRGVRIRRLRSDQSDETCTLKTNAVVLAVGHSARDTFEMLKDTGLAMEQKPFSIGVRMEHPQRLIDAAQYGEENLNRVTDAISAEHEPGKLPPADYRINCKAPNGRGVYSFCMCPGGEVVVCSTKEGELCVNGMSERRRDSGTANSGILCDVRPEDFKAEGFDADDVLAGVRFQEKYEKLTFENGGGDFKAPDCSMKAFNGELYYTEKYEAGNYSYEDADLRIDEEESKRAGRVYDSLPHFASEAIRAAIPYFAQKIKGYDHPDAVVTAVETRSSSPVRILRDEKGESNIGGVYPCGEGAGYAGGITSAACDGIRAAHHIIERFMPADEENFAASGEITR